MERDHGPSAEGASFHTTRWMIVIRVAQSQALGRQSALAELCRLSRVKTLFHRLRKRYAALLRDEVDRTVSDPAKIDVGSRALCEALIASEGWLGP